MGSSEIKEEDDFQLCGITVYNILWRSLGYNEIIQDNEKWISLIKQNMRFELKCEHTNSLTWRLEENSRFDNVIWGMREREKNYEINLLNQCFTNIWLQIKMYPV